MRPAAAPRARASLPLSASERVPHAPSPSLLPPPLQTVEGMRSFLLPTFCYGGQLFRALEINEGVEPGKQVRPWLGPGLDSDEGLRHWNSEGLL